ncbi:MAG: sulfatase-like hydrolase/transferase [Armatimonadota bacterium]|nr:MAG: sulfatase-like hydrolase/transferase [Armatimonadota bacterium]
MAADSTARQPKLPNIILLMSDQHRGDALSCEGHPVVRTPALDAVAAQGCRFTRAYTTSPLCMPARASLATGRYNHNHGMIGNLACVINPEERRRSVGLALQHAGYTSAFVGKHHLLPQPAGYDMRKAAGFLKREFGFDHLVQVMGKFGSMRADCDWTAQLKELGLLDVHRDDYRERKRQPVYFAKPSPLPRDEQCDSFTGRKAIEWLASAPPQPFFLWVSFPGPHDPWDAPGEYGEMYDPADMPLPIAWSDTLQGKPARQRERSERGGMPALEESDVKPMAAQYYGLVSNIDDWCGRILAALRESGVLDNTVVIYTSDHGEMLGDHRLVNKSVFYEGSARIPLLAADYRGPALGAVCSTPAEIIDPYRTILALAGVEPPDGTFGKDLMPLARGDATCGDGAAFSELGSACMVRAGRWKYVHDPRAGGAQELYDLEDDPEELRNLVGDVEYRAVADEMRSRLLDWLVATDARDLEPWEDVAARL